MKQTRNKYIISIYNSLFNTKNVKCKLLLVHLRTALHTLCSRKHEFSVRIQEKVQVNVIMSCAHKLMHYISAYVVMCQKSKKS